MPSRPRRARGLPTIAPSGVQADQPDVADDELFARLWASPDPRLRDAGTALLVVRPAWPARRPPPSGGSPETAAPAPIGRAKQSPRDVAARVRAVRDDLRARGLTRARRSAGRNPSRSADAVAAAGTSAPTRGRHGDALSACR
jgi:hypothetical protein